MLQVSSSKRKAATKHHRHASLEVRCSFEHMLYFFFCRHIADPTSVAYLCGDYLCGDVLPEIPTTIIFTFPYPPLPLPSPSFNHVNFMSTLLCGLAHL